VLEEQRFEPVGSNQTVRVDVRVIAATNKDLDKESRAARFARIFSIALNVIPFFVPPLRDRIADIPILGRHFLNEFSSEYGKKTRELSDNALEILYALSVAGQCARIAQPRRAPRHCLPASAYRARITSRPNFSAAYPKACINRTARCTKRAALTNANLFCASSRKIAGT